jgi:6-pyruvoyltetrahydropterin/6-carboxytetrahydropterin synthase
VFELTVEIPFSAAHRICGHEGPCANLHGHNYRALVTVAGDRLNEIGMLVDFGELKRVCAEVIAPLDHSYLNDIGEFGATNPTAEKIAQHIHRGIAARMADPGFGGIHLRQVTVYESERSSATYRE